jgi:hypothetical protein
MHLSTILLFVILVLSFVLTITIDAYKKTFTLSSIFGYVFGIVAYFLILLDQECVHNGPCNLWGWIRFALATLIFTFLITAKLTEVRQLQKPTEEPVKKV